MSFFALILQMFGFRASAPTNGDQIEFFNGILKAQEKKKRNLYDALANYKRDVEELESKFRFLKDEMERSEGAARNDFEVELRVLFGSIKKKQQSRDLIFQSIQNIDTLIAKTGFLVLALETTGCVVNDVRIKGTTIDVEDLIEAVDDVIDELKEVDAGVADLEKTYYGAQITEKKELENDEFLDYFNEIGDKTETNSESAQSKKNEISLPERVSKLRE